MTKLTHFNQSGEAHMVDVGAKDITQRSATCEGFIEMLPETLHLITEGSHKKGDVLGIARIAGIMASKKTAELILEGKNVTVGELSKAKNGQKLFRKKIEKFKTMNKIDLWLSPATTTAAPKGMATGSPLMNLPWTYAGLPTVTFPITKSVDNLPIGVQVSGSFYKDEELLLFTKLLNHKK